MNDQMMRWMCYWIYWDCWWMLQQLVKNFQEWMNQKLNNWIKIEWNVVKETLLRDTIKQSLKIQWNNPINEKKIIEV